VTRILLVEDNEMTRDMLARRLSRSGYEVIEAADGREALDLARDGIDLVVLDMSLPEMDGWEAARRLKGDPATRAIPIVAVTAHVMAGDREKALAAGCDGYVTKPVDFERLTGSIESLLA